MLFVVNPSAYLIEKVLMYMNDAIKCTKEEKINKRPHDRGNKLVQIQSMIKYHKIILGPRVTKTGYVLMYFIFLLDDY